MVEIKSSSSSSKLQSVCQATKQKPGVCLLTCPHLTLSLIKRLDGLLTPAACCEELVQRRVSVAGREGRALTEIDLYRTYRPSNITSTCHTEGFVYSDNVSCLYLKCKEVKASINTNIPYSIPIYQAAQMCNILNLNNYSYDKEIFEHLKEIKYISN